MPLQPCEHCGKPASSERARFCSYACRNYASRKEPVLKPCEYCGQPIPFAKGGRTYEYRIQRFCSVRCKNFGRGINPATTRYKCRRRGLHEHRAVMQETLGRPLLSAEVV